MAVNRSLCSILMEELHFTVDAALLRELGERLVGKPHIALAELIKNSYDADATHVIIRFAGDCISITDNGSGMTFPEFRDFWMRIGSPHKQNRIRSPRFGRSLTGSKGVGRLSVQLLADQLQLRTSAPKAPNKELYAIVDWERAVEAHDLTNATAEWTERSRDEAFAGNSAHGTELTLTRLHHDWAAKEFEDLARQIWFLQPPFSPPSTEAHDSGLFHVDLQTADPELSERFGHQMRAALSLWTARLRGHLQPDGRSGVRDRVVQLQLEFPDNKRERVDFPVVDCHLETVEYEIRVFHFQRRQSFGIKVQQARDYLAQYGGVQIYDAGFRLPYYGVDTDWLRIEMDHSHRLSASKLLPDELKVPGALEYLPTNSRIFGVVNVNTSLEAMSSVATGERRDVLSIQVTRDRLVDNDAYQDLITIVRWALDYYATRATQQAYVRIEEAREVEPLREKFIRVEHILSNYESKLAPSEYQALRREVQDVVATAESEAEALARQAGLLGALATAGISALAYEHEAGRQFAELEEIIAAFPEAADRSQRVDLAERLRTWVDRARSVRALFSPLMVEENRESTGRLRARPLLEQVRSQIRPLLRDLPIDVSGVDNSLRLPRGGLPQWSALFQNLFLNASNAMLDTIDPRISVRSEVKGRRRALYVEDLGTGVDLAEAENLFKPFVRHSSLSRERRSLGMGGTGLGLTIVRMIATELECTVNFVDPPEGLATSVRITWGE